HSKTLARDATRQIRRERNLAQSRLSRTLGHRLAACGYEFARFSLHGAVVVSPRVGVEIVEPIFLRPPVHPMLLRNLLTGQPLREGRRHGIELGHGGTAHGRVAGAMLLHEVLDEIGTLQDDTATGVLGTEFTEVAEKRGVAHGGVDAARVAD